MAYTEPTNGISISNAMPTTDAAGKVLTGTGNVFDFTVSANVTGSATVSYEIAAIKDTGSTLANGEVKLYLEKSTTGTYAQVMAPTVYTPTTSASSIGTPSGAMLLKSGTYTATTSEQYRLRMWIADTTVVGSTAKTFTVKVNVYGKVL